MATLTTKLEAVNSMLGHIGEAPVNTISNATALPISASVAVSVLDETSREVQLQGWHFNTEVDVELTPDTSGNINIPSNAVGVDTVDTTLDVTQRGARLYNRKERTYTFSSPVKVHVTYLFDWDELNEHARRYITLRASRVFQGRMVGSRELEALIARDEYLARALLEEADYQNSDRTIFDNIDAAQRIGINRNYDIV
jgi:hypothetical protein